MSEPDTINKFGKTWVEKSAYDALKAERDHFETVARRQVTELAACKHEISKLALINNEHSALVNAACDQRDTIQAENARLREALGMLRNEVRGTLHAHELAIRYDAGNSNWECLEIALKKAEEILDKDKGDK